MGGATDLPPGFHFFPSDEDLVVHFLRRKAANLPCRPDIIPTVLLQHYNPWELNGLHPHPFLYFHGKYHVLIKDNPQGTALQAGNQWYFFSHAAQSRISPNGYWNPIGADETVTSSGCIVGLKKTLIFCTGEPSKGFKTNWIMHEYHLQDGGYNVSGSSTSSSSSSSRKSQRKRVHSSTVSDTAYPVCFTAVSSLIAYTCSN
jgi:hypothetical protein